ncbi:hypothetical protein [Billgrantia ethanolica]|uniref:Uncharacterized protein n=1 Tax=Billgrantia ethanolica TaxID=2733486 RepID=A0ABS9A6G8_9GAMM|nr:hypothetical protein [Halomonas ethanolica]MCE8004408.1 hypothetical protein [Halomonas ethanolica]
MSLDVTKRSGFVLRLFSLAAFSCMVLFAGIVVIQNEELGKLIPPSTARTLSILFAYIVAMTTFNYALAAKGRNFMGWKSEIFIMSGFAVTFVGMFLPHAFPSSQVVVTESWIPFSSKENTFLKPSWFYAPISFIALPLFYKSWREIRDMPLWQSSKKYKG